MRKIVALIISTLIICNISVCQVKAAAKSPYTEYKWNGMKLTEISYGQGVIVSKGQYEAAHTLSKWLPYVPIYAKCELRKMAVDKGYLTYQYCDASMRPRWFANQGQKITISNEKTKTYSTTNTMSYTNSITTNVGIDIENIINIGRSWTNDLSVQYATNYDFTYAENVSMEYDMTKYAHKSYSLASYGAICVFDFYKYDTHGNVCSIERVHAYYEGYGQEQRLIYRD